MGRLRRGQIAVVTALALPALLGSVALGTDVSIHYYNWVQLQKGVDAAVLAGANYLPEQPDVATTVAQNYANLNAIQPSEIVSTTVSPDDQTITMQARRTVPYYFARVLGLTSGLVQAAATAEVTYPPGSIGVPPGGSGGSGGYYGSSVGQFGLVPIGVDYNTPYSYNEPVTLNYDQVGPGNWGSLGLGSPGGAVLRQNIADGYYGPIAVGDWVPTKPGKSTGPIDQGFNDRMSAGLSSDPSGTFSSHALNDPRVIFVPMVNWESPNGESYVEVMGFAALWVDSVSGGQIFTHFIGQVAPNSLPNPDAPYYGAKGPPLLIK